MYTFFSPACLYIAPHVVMILLYSCCVYQCEFSLLFLVLLCVSALRTTGNLSYISGIHKHNLPINQTLYQVTPANLKNNVLNTTMQYKHIFSFTFLNTQCQTKSQPWFVNKSWKQVNRSDCIKWRITNFSCSCLFKKSVEFIFLSNYLLGEFFPYLTGGCTNYRGFCCSADPKTHWEKKFNLAVKTLFLFVLVCPLISVS